MQYGEKSLKKLCQLYNLLFKSSLLPLAESHNRQLVWHFHKKIAQKVARVWGKSEKNLIFFVLRVDFSTYLCYT